MIIKFVLCFVILTSFDHVLADDGPVSAMSQIHGETAAFLEYLKQEKYDHRQRPDHQGDSTRIQVSILLGSIRKVSEVTMDYSIEIFFREEWRDKRLEFGSDKRQAQYSDFRNKTEGIGLHESYAAFLWHPDTFIPNAIESINPKDNSITHRSLLRLMPDGSILYSRRLSITAECPMDLTMFPFDSQVCRLEIESYGYRDEEVTYQWFEWSDGEAPIQWSKEHIKLPDFNLIKIMNTSTVGVYSTGNYSRLVCCFFFTRSSGFCFLQLIIPATAVVITSWVALWMENETTFQDMISVILTLTFLIYSYNTVMPRVSYIKAMDVYLGACFFFVFFSLIKLAIVKYMRQQLLIEKDQSSLLHALPMINMATEASDDTDLFGERDTSLGNNNKTGIHRRSETSDPESGRPMLRRKSTTNGTTALTKMLLGERQAEPRYEICRNRCFTYVSIASRLHFSVSCMRRFHLITQIMFPIVFIAFCMFYFLFYMVGYPDGSDKCNP